MVRTLGDHRAHPPSSEEEAEAQTGVRPVLMAMFCLLEVVCLTTL